MATKFTITARENPQYLRDTVQKGGATKYEIDFGPWAEDNDGIADVLWTLKSGDAAISSTALATSLASGLVTFPEAGDSLIQISATATNGAIYVANLDITIQSPETGYTSDYGFNNV